mgnify:CR=1 FL=1
MSKIRDVLEFHDRIESMVLNDGCTKEFREKFNEIFQLTCDSILQEHKKPKLKLTNLPKSTPLGKLAEAAFTDFQNWCRLALRREGYVL